MKHKIITSQLLIFLTFNLKTIFENYRYLNVFVRFLRSSCRSFELKKYTI